MLEKNFPRGAEVRWEAYCKGRLELSGGSYLRNRGVRKVISFIDFLTTTIFGDISLIIYKKL